MLQFLGGQTFGCANNGKAANPSIGLRLKENVGILRPHYAYFTFDARGFSGIVDNQLFALDIFVIVLYDIFVVV